MAEQANTSSPKRQFLFNPLKRPMPYIGLFIALLIVIFQGTIRKYTADYVGNWLISSLKDSTEGNYTLDYDFVRFDVFTKELRIQNFNLSLDTTVTDQETYLQQYTNLVDISTPLVVLKLESLWDLLVNEKLLIAFIGMQEPNIVLIRSENLTEEENIENQQATTEKIRSYLKELEIDSFRIVNGAIHVDLQNEQQQGVVDFRIRNFSTLLRGFKLDEINPDKAFQGLYAEELELEILDQEIILPKLHHKLKFTKLWISSTDSIIKLDTLKILPLPSADSSLIGNITLDELAFTGIDFRKAYDENIFAGGKLEFINPNITIVNKGNSKGSTQLEQLNLPFDELILQEINIHNGRINLDMDRKIASEHFNIIIKDFSIDSSSIALEELAKNLNDFSITADNSTIELADSIHEMKIGSITIQSKDSVALASNITVNPISSRRQYSLYKARGVGLINYSTVKQIYLTGIDFNQAINNHQFIIDSLQIFSPTSNITEYPYIKRKPEEVSQIPYLLKNVLIANGKVNYNRRQFGQNHRSQAQGVSITINNLYPETGNPIAYDQLNLFIQDGFSEIKQMAHTIKFRNLESNNLTSLDIGELYFSPDSSSIKGEMINFKSTDLRIRGFDQDQLKSGTLKLDELTAETVSLHADFSTVRAKSENFNFVQKAVINKFYINKGDIKIIDKANELSFSDVSTFIDSLHYDATTTTRATPIDFKDLLLSHGRFSIKSQANSTEISGMFGRFSETDSLINFEDIIFKSGNKIDGRLKEVYLKGFDRNALLAENGLQFNYLFLDHPTINIKMAKGSSSNIKFNNESIRQAILKQFSYIKFDSIISRNANIKLISDNRLTKINQLNIIIRDYTCDTTTNVNNVLQPSDFAILAKDISTTSENDTVSIDQVSLDMINNTLTTGSVNFSAYHGNGKIKVLLPGLVANGFTSTGLLNNNYSVDTIRLSNAHITLTTNDSIDNSINVKGVNENLGKGLNELFKKSNNLLFDTLFKANIDVFNIGKIEPDTSKNFNFKNVLEKIKLAKTKDIEDEIPAPIVHQDSLIKVTLSKKASATHGIINYISLPNSNFIWQKNNSSHSILSGLNFSVQVKKLILDTLNDFNVYNHLQDLTIEIKDYKLNLPDSLNSLSFDIMELSTQNESIAIKNITMTPRIGKYEYSNKVGHQAGWHHLQNLDITIDRLDLYKALSQKVVYIKKITASNGTLDIFKDKELPLPVNQRKPMLQDVIRNIDLPILIDSIEVDNFRINFSSRLSANMPEGSLEFHNLNAYVANLVNIDTAILKYPYLTIMASTNLMNKGLLSANFNFDMGDDNSSFIFEAHLSTMPAKDFNSLLEALAFVSIESGTINDLSMQAQGDTYYATGNMKFLYSDLKVSTINKKNLKTKGMGKVMKTFFANAFVVKKNNPGFKFFPRDGAMYYERDPQKIIIDYVTKTALSGVVSSIGGRNARKDIKKIQKESKKQKDAERKALKKASKRAIP